MPSAPQHLQFKTELKQLLDLIVHSLYTKKEIFLRELISNAADAIDRVRFESLTKQEILEDNSIWRIKLVPDETAGTLTVSDNGLGMSRESIVDNLGTIARSGTRQFMDALRQAQAKDRPELIGQFGVGFYASFMVADKVTVISRMAGAPADAVKWESDGQGEFSVEPCEKPKRGTDVILHLREDAKEFLSPWRLREIVKRYSDFIDHPIAMDVEHEKDGVKTTEEETLNSRQAIWLRSKSSIKKEEYQEFYKQIARDSDDPLLTIHQAAEGEVEYKALMYIPAHQPPEWMMGPPLKSGLDLYVRRVLIMHACEELVPTYLRFVKGVVDCPDLPLNVSREMLQHNPLLAKVRSNIVNRVLKTLEETRDKQYETYLKFYAEFGPLLKEGTAVDFANRDRLADLLLLESTKTEAGKYTTLAKYLAAMPTDQKEIYYLVGEARAQIEDSPYLEASKANNQEVLLLTDPVDEFLVSALYKYKDKPLKAVDKGELSATAEDEAHKKADADKFGPLLEALKKTLDQVKEVRLSRRLKQSAAILVAGEDGMTAHMERLMRRLGKSESVPALARILELNPEHPVVRAMGELARSNGADERLASCGRLLYDQAVVAEGSRIPDPGAFAARINELLARLMKM